MVEGGPEISNGCSVSSMDYAVSKSLIPPPILYWSCSLLLECLPCWFMTLSTMSEVVYEQNGLQPLTLYKYPSAIALQFHAGYQP